MSGIDPVYLEHQRKRWLRHDWRRFMPPDVEGDDPFAPYERK